MLEYLRKVVFLVVCLVLHLTSAGRANADHWTGILSPSRAIDWSNAGLPPTLPTGETTPNPWTPPTRTQCGATIASGASVATINAAIESCPPGTFILLGPGTFNVNNEVIKLFGSTGGINGVTLRGSGPMQTLMNLSGSGQIWFGQTWTLGQGTITAGLAKGSTSVTMGSVSAPFLLAPGMLARVSQCDSGYSGANCQTGSSTDDGALYICGNNPACQYGGGSIGNNRSQGQIVRVTSVTGSGPYTVTFTPGLYMPNWSTGRSAALSWATTYLGSTPDPHSLGLENLTIKLGNMTTNSGIQFSRTYASWIKGVRFIGIGTSYMVGMQETKNSLFANNYLFPPVPLNNADNILLQQGGSSDNLVVNNIMSGGVPWEGSGANSGNVVAYNYSAHANTAYYQNSMFEHGAGSAFALFEGNQVGKMNEDNAWGTHTLNTWFRNYVHGWDPPYVNPSGGSPFGITWEPYARFENAIGNIIGSAKLLNYQSTPASPQPNPVFILGTSTGGTSDTLVETTAMRWGNCDSVTGTCRFQNSEVPTSLSGTASPFQNSVPASTQLPCSFFLKTCNTPPSWWNVCKSWNSFPGSCATAQTPPFPAIGPDVANGAYVGGRAHDIPAAIAFQNLPIDPAYQQSFPITASSWSGGIMTLTVTGLPSSSHIIGGFQITGSPACNSPAGGEFVMTGSDATTIRYAVASNPGSCAGGTVKFPNIRQFDERVYGTALNAPPSPPTNLRVQ